MAHFVAIITVLVVSVSICLSGDIFVSPSGNDSTGDGSIGNPYLTVGKGISEMVTGDTLNIRAGEYGEYINNTLPTGTSWEIPTTVQAYGSEEVIFNPATPADVNIVHIVGNDKQYIVLNGIVFDGINMVNRGNCLKVTYSAAGEPAHHVRATNCTFKNAFEGMGILLTAGANYVPTYCEFLNCQVYNNGTGNANPPDKHGLYISTSSNIIDGCTFYSNRNVGIHLFDGIPSSTVVRNSKFLTGGSDKTGIGLYGGTNTLIYNNVFIGQQVGVHVRDDGICTNTTLLNNSFWSNGLPIQCQGEIGPITIANNLLSGQVLESFGGINIASGVTGGGISVAYNIIEGSGLKGQINDPDGAIASESNNLTNQVSVGYLNPNSSDLQLSQNSIAIDYGQQQSLFSTDILGVLRPKRLAWDVGAYELDFASVQSRRNGLGGGLRRPF